MEKRQRIAVPEGVMQRSQPGPVKIRFSGERDGQGLIELWLDFEKAEPPSRAYFADYADVLKGRSDITLLFGRLVPGTPKLRNQVEISFSQTSFVGQLWNSTRRIHDTLKASGAGIPRVDNVELSDVVHTSRANNLFLAVMSDEAICDFYYIAPTELHFVRMGRRHTVTLEPVIRICLAKSLVLEFLDRCEEVYQSIPEEQRMLVKGGEDEQP